MIKPYKQSKKRTLRINPKIVSVDINVIMFGNSCFEKLSLEKIELVLF